MPKISESVLQKTGGTLWQRERKNLKRPREPAESGSQKLHVFIFWNFCEFFLEGCSSLMFSSLRDRLDLSKHE